MILFKERYSICILLTINLLIIFGCKKNPDNPIIVYDNDFEQANLDKITGGLVATYNSSNVLGFYNNGGFKVELDNLEEHDLVSVSFDLFIHDSWSGNSKGPSGIIDGPDIWEMKLDGLPYIRTTFSNTGDCAGGVFCLQQSYPNNFPFSNDVKIGSYDSNLPGLCLFKDVPGGTTLYKIEKIIKHKNKLLLIEFKDELKQSNSADPLCDESWSLDNLVIKTLVLK